MAVDLSRARRLDVVAPAPAGRPSRPPLRVVPARHRRRRAVAAATAAGLLVFGLLLALVMAQTVLMRNQARIDQLDKDIVTATEFQQRARLLVDQMEAPQAIVKAAVAQGMVLPPQPTYLTPDGQTVRDVMESQQRAISGASSP